MPRKIFVAVPPYEDGVIDYPQQVVQNLEAEGEDAVFLRGDLALAVDGNQLYGQIPTVSSFSNSQHASVAEQRRRYQALVADVARKTAVERSIQYILANTNPEDEPVLHLNIVPPECGFLFTPDDIAEMKRRGIKVVLNIHSYPANREGDSYLQRLVQAYAKEANHLIFVQPQDRALALADDATLAAKSTLLADTQDAVRNRAVYNKFCLQKTPEVPHVALAVDEDELREDGEFNRDRGAMFNRIVGVRFEGDDSRLVQDILVNPAGKKKVVDEFHRINDLVLALRDPAVSPADHNQRAHLLANCWLRALKCNNCQGEMEVFSERDTPETVRAILASGGDNFQNAEAKIRAAISRPFTPDEARFLVVSYYHFANGKAHPFPVIIDRRNHTVCVVPYENGATGDINIPAMQGEFSRKFTAKFGNSYEVRRDLSHYMFYTPLDVAHAVVLNCAVMRDGLPIRDDDDCDRRLRSVAQVVGHLRYLGESAAMSAALMQDGLGIEAVVSDRDAKARMIAQGDPFPRRRFGAEITLVKGGLNFGAQARPDVRPVLAVDGFIDDKAFSSSSKTLYVNKDTVGYRGDERPIITPANMREIKRTAQDEVAEFDRKKADIPGYARPDEERLPSCFHGAQFSGVTLTDRDVAEGFFFDREFQPRGATFSHCNLRLNLERVPPNVLRTCKFDMCNFNGCTLPRGFTFSQDQFTTTESLEDFRHNYPAFLSPAPAPLDPTVESLLDKLLTRGPR